MKKVYVFIIICLFAFVASTTNKHRLRNRKSELSFSNESFTESREKPVVMEHIFTARPIKVQASYSTIGEEKQNRVENLSNNQRFKENTQGSNNYELKNLEAPTIVKTLGYQERFNVGERVSSQLDQTITNRQAYDIVYPNHKAYYNDKRFVVFDKNFNQVESYLLNQFKSAIDSAIDYNSNSNLVHVDQFDKTKVNFKGMNIQNNAPYINKEAVQTSINLDKIDVNDPGLKISSSDPYGTIFGKYAN